MNHSSDLIEDDTRDEQENILPPIRKISLRTLVIGPVGKCGMKILGLLSSIEDEGLLESIDTFCGSSNGAVLALLLAVGYHPRELNKEMLFFTERWSLSDFRLTTVLSLIKELGLLSLTPIEEKINDLVKRKMGNVPSLYELYIRTGNSLIVQSLNVSGDLITYDPFRRVSFLEPTCVQAVIRAMSMPLLFRKSEYIDGSLIDPYPVELFDDGNTSILGIHCNSTNILSIIDFINNFRIKEIISRTSNRCHHVEITEDGKEDIFRLIDGYQLGKKLLLEFDTFPEDTEEKENKKKKYNYPPKIETNT